MGTMVKNALAQKTVLHVKIVKAVNIALRMVALVGFVNNNKTI
jgi:hypothetical protein